MAVTLRAAPVASSPGNVTSISLTLPSGVVTGDRGLIFLVGTGATVAAPSGWTEIATHSYSTSMYLHIYTRDMSTGDSGNVTFALATQNRTSATLIVLSGVTATITGADVGTLSSSLDPPAVTRTGTRAGLTYVCERGSSGTSTAFTAPTGWAATVGSYGSGSGATTQGLSWLLDPDPDGTIDPPVWGRDGTASGLVVATVSVGSPAGVVTSSRSTTWSVADLVQGIDYSGIGHISAHRGGNPGPEETGVAYDASDAISPTISAEGDMHVLADGSTIALCHDDTIDRTASPSSPITTGAVASFTPAQWATITMKTNTGFTGPDAPAGTLAMLAEKYGPGGSAGHRRILVLEAKGGDATAMIAAIKSLGLAGQTIVQGFTLADVVEAVQAGLHGLYLNDAPNWASLASSGIEHVGMSSAAITAQACTDAHAAGIKVWAYTVNSASQRNTLRGLGVDAFFTNAAGTLYRSTISTSRSTTWTTSAVAEASRDTSWSVRASITSARASTWAVAAQVTTSRSATWSTLRSVTAQRATTWTVASIGVVSASRSTTWAVARLVSTTRATTWSTSATVAVSVTTTWDVLAAVGPVAVTTTWTVVATVGPAPTLRLAQPVVRLRTDTARVTIGSSAPASLTARSQP